MNFFKASSMPSGLKARGVHGVVAVNIYQRIASAPCAFRIVQGSIVFPPAFTHLLAVGSHN